jgi:hypothetical protein
MKRKHLSRSEALGRVSSMPRTESAQLPKPESMQAFKHRYESEQEEIRNAPLKAAQHQVSQSLRRLIEQDQPTLYVAPSSFLAATAPQVADNQFAGISIEDCRASIRRAYSEFEDSIAADGKLTASGKQKLQALAKANLNCNSTQVAFWSQAFYLLLNLGELSELDFIETPQPQATQPTESFDSILEILPDTHDGRKDARALCDADYFGREGAAMMSQWEAHIYRDYGVILTDNQKKEVVSWLVKWNKSPLVHESWNAARRALGKAQVIPLMVTEDEALAERLEHSNLNDYSARREFASESRRIIAGR